MDDLKESAQTASSPSKFMAFLNSAFGIWLLSSVAVGLITFLYSQYDAKNKSVETRIAYRDKIKIEVYGRVDQYKAYTKQIELNPNSRKNGMAAEQIDVQQRVLLHNLLDTPKSQDEFRKKISGTYPEFDNRRLISLISELRMLEEERVQNKFSPSNDDLISLQEDFIIAVPAEELKNKVIKLFPEEYWKKLAHQ